MQHQVVFHYIMQIKSYNFGTAKKKKVWSHEVKLRHEHSYNAVHGVQPCRKGTAEFVKEGMFQVLTERCYTWVYQFLDEITEWNEKKMKDELDKLSLIKLGYIVP